MGLSRGLEAYLDLMQKNRSSEWSLRTTVWIAHRGALITAGVIIGNYTASVGHVRSVLIWYVIVLKLKVLETKSTYIFVAI